MKPNKQQTINKTNKKRPRKRQQKPKTTADPTDANIERRTRHNGTRCMTAREFY